VASYGAGFWVIALVFVTGMAFSTVPTPLYPLYQARDGFSTFTVTVVFAVYVIGVLTSLLLAGQVSDLVGRKKVLTVALALELVAAALFLAEPPLVGAAGCPAGHRPGRRPADPDRDRLPPRPA
jgi:MFS family permease